MKRKWILRLAVTVGMALLAATPGFGDDKNATNVKKPAADAKKPAANVSKPATDAQKASAKNDRQIPNTTTPIANTKMLMGTKPVFTAKPVAIAKPAVVAKPVPKVNAAANSKPVSNAKPAAITKGVVEVKQATIVKPVSNAKAVTNNKPVITARMPLANTKPASNVKAASNSKPVASSKRGADVKLVATTKTTQTAKPVVNTKPAAGPKLVATATTQPKLMKPLSVNKPIVTASATTMMTKPVQKGLAPTFQLPANYEQLNLTNPQRDKATAVMNKYEVQIRNLESKLNDMKAGREKELSALLTPQQQTQLAKFKGESQPKPSTNSGPARSAPTSGSSKSAANKGSTVSRDNKTASAAPISNEKMARKTRGSK